MESNPPSSSSSGDASASSGADSTFVPERDYGTLLWAPQNHRVGMKPILRYLAEFLADDNTIKGMVKYLIVQPDQCFEVEYSPDLFKTELYQESEPLPLPKGDWNFANVCFLKEKYEKEDSYYIAVEVFQETWKNLPSLEPEAIWAEKPKIEYVELLKLDINLRSKPLYKYSDRIRVVTHKDFDSHETKMVMKIWPSPMCNKTEIEREMMTYKACDGKGITPKFLGHVTEMGRVMGMLIEYIEGAHKPGNEEEKELCRQALGRFHGLTGWHRNPTASHKDNFLIKDGTVYIIDLGNAYTPEDVVSKGHGWAGEKV
ncbi:hypothetical protein VM1G_00128 [Cytospora mali]|uniref:Protein kinase domain-containing protein n=1 Tax=Cytospora mali TaxID=578113 RepID=A0A194VL77_CYTMA|nr:hypothetical protein VM1G_00128 [Valsa mali]